MLEGQYPRDSGWAWAADWIERYPDLSESDRVEAREALRFFFDELGVDWPGWPRRYPIATQLIGVQGSGPLEIVSLHRRLQRIQDVPNVDLVLPILTGSAWNDYMSGRQMLGIAAAFRQAGKPTEFIRPTHRGERRPDLKVQLLTRWMYIECTALHEPESLQRAHEIAKELNHWASAHGLLEKGTAIVEVADLNVAEFEDAIPGVKDALVQLANRGVEGVENLPSITIKFFPQLRGAQVVISPGPVVERYATLAARNDVKRIKRKLKGKRGQLIGKGPTLALVRNHSLFSGHTRDFSTQLAGIGDDLAHWLSRYPEIGGVLAYEEWWGELPQKIVSATDEFRAIVNRAPQGHVRAALLIPNRRANIPLTQEELAALVGDSMIW